MTFLNKENFEKANIGLFARWAKWYDGALGRFLFFEPAYKKIQSLIQSEFNDRLQSGGNIADVACGTGEIIYRLARQFRKTKFVGADLTEKMLVKAKEKTAGLVNVNFIEANVENLPFPDSSFDIIICSDAFHHFYEPERALREFYRALRPSGFLLLVDVAIKENVFLSTVGPIFKRVEHAKEYYSKAQLKEMLEAAGFGVKKEFTYFLNNYFLAERR